MFTINIDCPNSKAIERCKELFSDVAILGMTSIYLTSSLSAKVTFNPGNDEEETNLVVKRLHDWLGTEIRIDTIKDLPKSSYYIQLPFSTEGEVPLLPHSETITVIFKSLPQGYRKTSEGFTTNDDNWKPGKWLI